MTEKSRFNIIDVLLILVIASVLFVAGFMLIDRQNKNVNNSSEYVNVRYILQINDLKEEFADNVLNNENVYEAEFQANIGAIAADPEIEVMKYNGTDADGNPVISEKTGYVSMTLTVEGNAKVYDDGYKIGEYRIYVGKSIPLILPDLSCTATCIDFETIG